MLHIVMNYEREKIGWKKIRYNIDDCGNICVRLLFDAATDANRLCG